jgi:hypothetical protein
VIEAADELKGANERAEREATWKFMGGEPTRDRWRP